MATFGQGINPQLGAIDYSPILRGSLAGAQMAAQGSQMIGQGLANLGQEVGKGIQEYTKKKEESDMYTTGIESKMARIGAAMQRFAAHPEEFGGVSPISKEEFTTYTTNAQKSAGGSLGAKKSFYAELSSLEDRVQKAPEVALRNIQLVAARNDQEQTRVAQQSIGVGLAAMAAGRTKNPLEAIRAAGYDVNEKVASYFANLAHVNAQTGLAGSQGTLAEATAFDKLNPVAKQRTQYVDIYQGLKAKHIAETGRLPTPTEDSNYQFQAAQAGRAQTVINLGDNSFSKEMGVQLVPRQIKEYDNAVDAQMRLQKLSELKNLIETGDVTTGLGADLFNGLNQARAQFLNDIKANKTVTNTQILDTLLGAGVFGAISEQKLGSKNFDTPVEMKNIRAAFVGDKGFTKDSIKAITDYRIKAEITAAERFAANQKAGVYDNFYKENKFVKPDFSFLPPKGVSFDVWQNMTPERRANWNSK